MCRLWTRGCLLLGVVWSSGCSERSLAPSMRDEVPQSVNTRSELTSTISDPVGDLKNSYPAYLDLTRASVALKGGRFEFAVELAAPVPADLSEDPLLPTGLDHVGWEFGLETDPTTSPVGYPFTEGTANFAEFYLGVNWNPTGSFGLGTGFIGLLVDRRPLLTGGGATITPLKFVVQGNRIEVIVDADALGRPSAFSWIALTHAFKYAHPTHHNVPLADVAPSDFSLAPWPSQ